MALLEFLAMSFGPTSKVDRSSQNPQCTLASGSIHKIPNSSKPVRFTCFGPQSRYYLCTWSPRASSKVIEATQSERQSVIGANCLLYGPEYSPLPWSHGPKIASINSQYNYNISGPQHDIGKKAFVLCLACCVVGRRAWKAYSSSVSC